MKYVALFFQFLTFPGVILHAFLEHVICKMYQIKPQDTRYFQKNEMAGHIDHPLLPSLQQSILFSLLPALFQMLFGILMIVPAMTQLIVYADSSYQWLYWFLLWVGISLLSHKYPNYEDALNLWEQAMEKNTFLKILLFPYILWQRAGSKLQELGLTFLINILLLILVCVFFL